MNNKEVEIIRKFEMNKYELKQSLMKTGLVSTRFKQELIVSITNMLTEICSLETEEDN